MTLVSDLSALQDEPTFEISICNVAIMGTKYGRKQEKPHAISLVNGSSYFFKVEKIKALIPIGNELDIGLRERRGDDKLSWVDFGADGETVTLRPPIGAEGIHLLHLESYDKNSEKFI